MSAIQPIQLTVVYDNNPLHNGLQTDWGFSCFIKGLEKSILFDTGKNGKILLSNMEKCGIRPEEIDFVLLSHDHKDHTGGLESLLKRNPHIEVWLPDFFPSTFKELIKSYGAEIAEVDRPQNICDRAYTTGVISGWIKEQSLILDLDRGLILITGCAHPRIIKIISAVKDFLDKDVDMTLGGFHLGGYQDEELQDILSQFRALGVTKVGPCHCSGEASRVLFAEEYKDNFLEVGVGKRIEIR